MTDFRETFIPGLMYLNSVLIDQNIIPEQLYISAIDQQNYLCPYDKTLKDFVKKSLNAVFTSFLKRSVFGVKKNVQILEKL